MDWHLLFFILCPVSMGFSLIIPIMYYFHPKTRQHPSILLLIICLAECSQIYHQFVNIVYIDFLQDDEYNFIYEQQLESIIEYFPFLLRSNMSDLLQLNGLYVFFCLLLQFFFYTAWCIDLILTLKKPFLTTKSRLLVQIPTPFVLTFIELQFIFDIHIDYQITLIAFRSLVALCINYLDFLVSIIAIVLVTTVIICLSAIYSTSRKSNNYTRDVKLKYLTQQAISQLLFIIILSAQFMVLQTSHPLNIPLIVRHISSSIYLGQGIILGSLRLYEKYFREQLFESICKILRIKKTHTITQIELANEAWNIPFSILLKNIQSQEIMSGILKGIKRSVKNYEVKSENLEKQMNTIIIKTRGSILRETRTLNSINQEDLSESLILEDQQVQITVIEYAPSAFAQLRNQDNIYVARVKESLSVSKNEMALNQISQSVGKSGSIFFKSHDNNFIIKTIDKSELDFLVKILPKYRSFILSNSQSLLARIYGCYTIQIENVSPVYLILMENTFQRINGTFQTYDMKGSLIGRKTSDLNYGKDSNFLEQDGMFITLHMDTTVYLQDQIIKDSEFLRDLNIMDYSLLLGVQQGIAGNSTRDSKYNLRNSRYVFDQLNYKQYSFGIIDYLQQYDNQKYIENRYKSLFNLEELISSIEPQQYQDRFTTFLSSIICGVQIY